MTRDENVINIDKIEKKRNGNEETDESRKETYDENITKGETQRSTKDEAQDYLLPGEMSSLSRRQRSINAPIAPNYHAEQKSSHAIICLARQ